MKKISDLYVENIKLYIYVYFILLTAYGYVLSSYYVFYNYIRLCVVTCFFENSLYCVVTRNNVLCFKYFFVISFTGSSSC